MTLINELVYRIPWTGPPPGDCQLYWGARCKRLWLLGDRMNSNGAGAARTRPATRPPTFAPRAWPRRPGAALPSARASGSSAVACGARISCAHQVLFQPRHRRPARCSGHGAVPDACHWADTRTTEVGRGARNAATKTRTGAVAPAPATNTRTGTRLGLDCSCAVKGPAALGLRPKPRAGRPRALQPWRVCETKKKETDLWPPSLPPCASGPLLIPLSAAKH